MLKLKKTAVAVLALGSSAVFAGTMGPVCAPGNVTIPCEKTAWDLGAQALYLQTSIAGDAFYDNAHTFSPDASGTGTYNQTSTGSQGNWGWGFMVEGSYHFNTGNDINLNWYHYNVGQPTTLSTSYYNVGANNYNPQWDQVDVEMAQQIDFSDMKNMRLHAGVNYSRVKSNLSTRYTEPVSGAIAANNGSPIAVNQWFSGFGPRFGMDLNYGLGNGLSMYGDTAASLMAGTFSKRVAISPPATGGGTSDRFQNTSATNLVPELEGKLGLKYDYSMAQGDVTFNVGYMWVNYFNAVTTNGYNTTSIPSSTTPMPNDYANFGLNGLNFGLKWVGTV